MNIYYYLFYKLSRALNKKGNNELGAIQGLSMLVSLNIVLIYLNVLPVTRENYHGGYKIGLAFVLITLFVINSILFLNKKRRKEIMQRFKAESQRSRRIGNFLVITYVVMTIVSTIALLIFG